MRTRSNLFTLLLVLCIAVSSSAQFGTNNRLLFIANMDGQQEVPSVTTNARGVATFMLSEDRNTVVVNGVFSGLSGAITGCHIHTGATGVSGPVYVNFSSNASGNRLRADIAIPSDFISMALNDQLYLNVHTAANPGGEIRGQLHLMTDEFFAAPMDGNQEVPSVAGSGFGVGLLAYSPGSNTARYSAVVNGLSGSVTASHIHEGATGVAGPVVVALALSGNSTVSNNIDLSGLATDFKQKLAAGDYYINVHTANNPAGEVRGQLFELGPLAFETILNGAQETPPVTTSASGVAVAALSPNLDTLTYYIGATGLTPTAAHFHKAAPGAAGGVVVALQTTAIANFYSAKIAVDEVFVTDLLNGNIYVNVHTVANPGGEIRGQMEPLLRRVYAFDLCSDQEVPPNASTGIGAAVVSTDRLNTNMDYLFIVDGLSGNATAAHIHDGAIGVSGPVAIALNTPSPASSGMVQITGADAVKLESGDTYLNVHTAANPAGEVRGQVLRALGCAANVPTVEPVVISQAVFPNPTAGMAMLRLQVGQGFEGRLSLSDPAGKVYMREHITLTAGEQMLPLDLKALPAGLYFGRIDTGQSGQIAVFKIVRE
ncbi:MAG: CHRD domain-containing protein [Lewinellaceae bacterium]|nr:CHRD domain-containing protein [Lewinellaceae bacterium]